MWPFKREQQSLIRKAITGSLLDLYLLRNMVYLFTLQWISDLTVCKCVFFLQINLFLNGQHVEIFEEDLTFSSDEVVSLDLPKISSELKGVFIFVLVNVSFAIFVLVNPVRFCLWNTFCLLMWYIFMAVAKHKLFSWMTVSVMQYNVYLRLQEVRK